MNVFVVVMIAMVTMVWLLRKHWPVGPSLLVAGAIFWVFLDPSVGTLGTCLYNVGIKPQTYDLVGALYFVVCLEIEMNKSGCLNGMVRYLIAKIPSLRLTMAIMPAFLGLLPSIGGARFSVPIVDTLARNQGIANERLSAINFWFRHVFEYTSPLVPSMILTCTLAGIGIGELIGHVAWVVVLAFVCGWIVLIRPIRTHAEQNETIAPEDMRSYRRDFVMCLIPIAFAFVLMVGFGLKASAAMGLVSLISYVALRLLKRGVPFKRIYLGAVEWRLLRDIFCILFFIELLEQTGALMQIVEGFRAAPLPIPVIIAMCAFTIGVLCGTSQGPCAILTPIAVALPGFDLLDLVGVLVVYSFAGVMVTPTHMCMMISLDYFKSDFFRMLRLCFITMSVKMAVFSLIVWYFWF